MLDILYHKRMENSIIIKKGSQGLYYMKSYTNTNKDIAFDAHFPILWAVRELKVSDFPRSTFEEGLPEDKVVTGALNCEECAIYGSFNGVVTSYCIDCLSSLQSIGEKCGCLCMYRVRTSRDVTISDPYRCPCDSDECCFKTYLKGVNLWEIGDIGQFNRKKEKTDWGQEFVASKEDVEIRYEEEYDIEQRIKDNETISELFSEFDSSSISSSGSLLESLSSNSICGDDDEDVEMDEDMPELIECTEDEEEESGTEDYFYRGY